MCMYIYIYVNIIYDIENHHTVNGLIIYKRLWYSYYLGFFNPSNPSTHHHDTAAETRSSSTHDPGLRARNELRQVCLISNLHEISMASNGEKRVKPGSGTVPPNVHLVIYITNNTIKFLERCNVCHWRVTPPFDCFDPYFC